MPSEALGWDSVASDLEIHDVPGIHATMVVSLESVPGGKFAPVLDLGAAGGGGGPRGQPGRARRAREMAGGGLTEGQSIGLKPA